MDKPTARIIAVAGARGAGHHRTEGTTMEHTHEHFRELTHEHAVPTRPAALMG